ncbi:MAG TPA: microcin ABC transporter permease, partial [bacterium]
MWAYILKRILLMVPTLFGIILITFAILQVVPGGPVERMVAALTAGSRATEGGGFGGASPHGARDTQAVTQELITHLNKLYGFDQPVYIQFANWLR